MKPISICEKTKTNKEVVIDLLSCTVNSFIGFVCLDIISAVSLHFLGHSDAQDIVQYGQAYLVVAMAVQPLSMAISQFLSNQCCLHLNNLKTKSQYLLMTMAFLLVTYTFLGITVSIICWNERWIAVFPLILLSQFLSAEFECLKAYMMAHQIFRPFVNIYISTMLLHIVWCLIIVSQFNSILIAIAAANCLTEITNFIILKTFVKFPDVEIVQFTIKEMLQYMYRSLAMVVHQYINNVTFFLLTAFTISLGDVAFSAQLGFVNTSSIYFKFPFSLSFAFITFISTELGQENLINIKTYIRNGMTIQILFLVTFTAAIWIYRYDWMRFYSDDENVQMALLATLPVFLIGSAIIDGLCVSLGGILKGLNESEFVSKFTLVTYLSFGLPLIYILTFPCELGLKGIWGGFGTANCVLIIGFLHKLRNHKFTDNPYMKSTEEFEAYEIDMKDLKQCLV